MKTKKNVESKKGKIENCFACYCGNSYRSRFFINLSTLLKYDGDKNVIYVGSAVKSKIIDYKDKSSEETN